MNTLQPLADRYLLERRNRGEISLATWRNQRCHLQGLVDSFGGRPLDHFTRRAVERWQETIGRLSAATRRARLSTVRVFCRWAVERDLLLADPTRGVPRIAQPRSVPRALPERAVAALFEVLPDARAELIVWLMVGLGLRCGEVAGLAVTDYDPGAATVTVTGKGGHERVLPVEPPEIGWAIEKYLAETGVVAGPLVRSVRQPWHGLNADSVSRLVARWMAEAGIKVRNRDGRSAHALRHTAASDVLDRSKDLHAVQAMLGHRNLSTTSIYLRRANLGQLRKAMSGRSYRAA